MDRSAVLVPLDGSELAERALVAAMELCRFTGRRLHAVCVRASGGSEAADGGRCEEAYLREVAARCGGRAGLAIRTALLEGVPALALATYVQEHGIGLVLMTSHGAGGVNPAWLGSVADALVRRLRVPVLLLRGEAAGSDGANGPLRHIVVPVDGSELSARVLGPAARLFTAPDTHLTLLHVLANPTTLELGSHAVDEVRDDAELILDELAAPLRAQGRQVDVAVVWSDHPAHAILGFAAAEQADAIAMATCGHGGRDRHATGSVADKIIRASLLPLLLYRPPALEGTLDASDDGVGTVALSGAGAAVALRAG